MIIVGNWIRLTGTVFIGATRGPGSIEPFHDGAATGFAVVFTLAALLLFVSTLHPPPPRPMISGPTDVVREQLGATLMRAGRDSIDGGAT